MSINPEFVPIAKFSSCYRDGWRMVEGYDLKAGDYAVLMVPPQKRTGTRKAGADHRVDRFLKVLGSMREAAHD